MLTAASPTTSARLALAPYAKQPKPQPNTDVNGAPTAVTATAPATDGAPSTPAPAIDTDSRAPVVPHDNTTAAVVTASVPALPPLPSLKPSPSSSSSPATTTPRRHAARVAAREANANSRPATPAKGAVIASAPQSSRAPQPLASSSSVSAVVATERSPLSPHRAPQQPTTGTAAAPSASAGTYVNANGHHLPLPPAQPHPNPQPPQPNQPPQSPARGHNYPVASGPAVSTSIAVAPDAAAPVAVDANGKPTPSPDSIQYRPVTGPGMSYGSAYQSDDHSAAYGARTAAHTAGGAEGGSAAAYTAAGPVAASGNLPVAAPVMGGGPQQQRGEFAGAHVDPESQQPTGGSGGSGGKGKSDGEGLSKWAAIQTVLFSAFMFCLFIANMSVYDNANNAAAYDACGDMISFVCLWGVFCLFAWLWGAALIGLWFRLRNTPEPLAFDSPSTAGTVLRWSTVVMGLFWVATFIVGFAATHWVRVRECGVKDVREMSTADIVLGWFLMAGTVYLIVRHRPKFTSSV